MNRTPPPAPPSPWTRLRRGDTVPRIRLPSADGAEQGVRGRGPRVLVVTHPDCPACRTYLRGLGEARDALGVWGADVLAVVPGGRSVGRETRAAGPETGAVPMVLDEAADPGAGLSVLVLDRWGEVYYAGHHGGDHDAESPEELVDWARFAAIQCPECEGPEGPWLQVGDTPTP